MTFFLNSQLGLSRSLRSNENQGRIFEAATSKFCNHSWHFFSSPQNGKVDLCMTNGSKVLIYLTLLYFIFYCTLVSNAKGNLAKSNKSELWNRLSYRGLPYHFEVRSQSFRNDCKSWRSQPQKFNLDFHSTSTTSKGLSENSKKMSWVNPVFPIDTENSIGFIVQFLRLLRSNENWGWFFEAATSNFCNHSWNFSSSPRNGKVDLCTRVANVVAHHEKLLTQWRYI